MQKLEFDDGVKERLKGCIGQELKYKDLCVQVGLPIKAGSAKVSQLKELTSYCDIVKLQKPTRYLVKEVYDVAFDVFNQIATNDKFQITFDAVLFQALLNNGGYPLYASGLELVEMFQEVNKNFAFTFNRSDMTIIGGEYDYMSDISEVVYRILLQWTKRKIESMNKRGIIRLCHGYRVYKEQFNDKGKRFLIKYNVPLSTSEKINELDCICNRIYLNAVDDVLPKRTALNKDTKEIEIVPYYPPSKMMELEKRLTKDIKEETNDEYCKMKRVNIIMPPDSEWLINRLSEIYTEIPDLKSINEEACKKVLETSQLDRYTNEERKNFILFNMSYNPPFVFSEKIKEKELENEIE